MTNTDNATASEPAQVDYKYAWYASGVLMLAYTFSFLDRQILNLMVGPIRADLNISDFQFALLAGAAFGIFYTIMGLPLGWAADRFKRKWIITAGVTVWSLMTMLCGFARNFPQLFAARIGVGVGEAALSPSAYSMLSDYFDKSRLPRAMSIYTTGIFVGAGIALILGGAVVSAVQTHPDITLPLIGQMKSWHMVFVIVGLPGLLLALLMSTLKEPERRDRTVEDKDIKLGAVFSYMRRFPMMSVSLMLGAALYSVTTYSDTWYPELFIRTWDWSPAQSGMVNGISSLVGGPIGLIFAGWYSGHLLKRGVNDACLRLTAYGALAITIPATLMPLMPSSWMMAGLLFPTKLFSALTPVLIPSAIQLVAPNQIRGQMGAIFLFTVGILGVSLGPILPATLTDFIFHDDNALRYSLSITTAILGPLTFVTLWMGLKEYRAAFAEAEARRAGQEVAS
ncbi:MFS transporter [uncultured Hyphomonas sp.]|uniref:MFS transporter n=1 Tax=uncultured Hyphomonas sp. TaxID=225298 RepID=UPI002AAB224A|nr:MFS transporter [uncultured Hyphomonas sp.]